LVPKSENMTLRTVDVSAVWIEEGISQRRFSK